MGKKFTVERSGMAFDGERSFVVDEDGDVVAEVWGRTKEKADRLAELVAKVFEADAYTTASKITPTPCKVRGCTKPKMDNSFSTSAELDGLCYDHATSNTTGRTE